MANQSDTQRVSWNLPANVVDRVKEHQESNDFANQSEAAADLLTRATGAQMDPGASSGQTIMHGGTAGDTVVSLEPGITSLGDERHSVPEFVDPHESYPATNPMVPPGETVPTIGTDGAPIAEGTTGVIGDSEETADGLPDVGVNPNSTDRK